MAKRKSLAVIDFETDPFEHGQVPQPFACGIYDGEHYHEWYDDESDADLLISVAHFLHDKNWRVYAHNGGKFDFFYLLPFIDSIFLINGRIAKCTIGECTLVDSYLLLPFPLSAYKKDEIDYRLMGREYRYKKDIRKKIKQYLYGDCSYLYQWVNEWRERFGTKLTLAATAFSEIKKSGYEITKHTNEQWDNKFRRFYYGGRTQAFKGGEIIGDYKYVDINSSYPFAMLHPHPYGYEYDVERGTLPATRHGNYFAEIFGTSHGALPKRNNITGALGFPHETTYFNATGWEIIAGLETGTLEIHHVNNVYNPRETKSFEDFINLFYKEKLEAQQSGDDTRYMFAKLLQNSGYGKFALNPRDFKDYIILPAGESPENENYELEFSYDDYEIWSIPSPAQQFYNVMTAASITGFSRAHLWRAICSSEDVLYCDTDSMVCRETGVEIGDRLGQWKIEAEIDRAYIGGKKLYAFREKTETYKTIENGETIENYKWKTASKGARLSPAEIVKICRGEKIKWKNDAPSFSLRYGARFVDRNIESTF